MSARQYNNNLLKHLEKVTTGDMSAGGLIDENFDQFFQDVQEQSEVLQRARAVPVTAASGDIPRLGVGTRVMRAVNEGESTAENSVDQPSVPYETQKISIPWSLTWESINETIGNLENAIMNAFATVFAGDLEIVASVGDESSSDAFESINDGWYTLATAAGSAIYNHDDAGDGTGTAQPVDKSLFSGMRSAMPERFKERQTLVFLGSNAQKEAWQEALTDRNTAAGDAMLIQGDEPTPFGHTWLTPMGWPDDRFMMTSMNNLAYVIQDDMRVKSTTQAKENVMSDVEVFVNLLGKVDYQIVESAGIVRAEGVEAP